MIIDAHTHIFPKEIKENRERYFDKEPSFCLLYESPQSNIVTTEDTLGMMDEEGLDKAVVFGVPWQQMELIKRHNDAVLEAVHQYPNRFLGLCCVNPMHQESVKEVERCFEAGCVGVGEIAFYDSDITDEIIDVLDPIMALCRKYNRPLLLHANEPIGHAYAGKSPSTIKQLYKLLCRYTDTKIILAHLGGGLFFYALLKKETSDMFTNLWIDCAAVPYLYQPQVYALSIALLGEEKLLFGSDYPLLRPSRYFAEMDKANLTPSQLQKIKGENAAKLFL